MKNMKKSNLKNHRDNQSGVTLLMAVLVLSAITAISFSLAAVVFAEIRASGDLQRTEPALYATQGVIEQSIYKVQRDVPDDQMCFDPSTLTDPTKTNCLNNSPIKSNINVVSITGIGAKDVSDSPISEVVPAAYNTVANTKNVYSIYDTDNPNSPQYGYTRVTIDNPTTGTTLYYSFCVVNEAGNSNPIDCSPGTYPNSSWKNYDTVLNIGTNRVFDLDKTYIYRLYIYRPTGQSAPGYVNISSWGPASSGDTCTGGGGVGECNPKGLPLKGKKQVDVTAANAGLTRRYRVLVPLSK